LPDERLALVAMHQLVPALDSVGTEAVADPEVAGDDADPGKFAEIELDLFRRDDGLSDEAGVENGHDRPVLRRRSVEGTHRRETAGPRHVLDDDGGIARDVLAYVTGDRPCIGVIAAARREADDDGDGFSLEVGRRVRLWRGDESRQSDGSEKDV
jgi:hypothetical protein